MLWCLTALSTIFQLYRAVSFIGGGNRKKTIDMSHVTKKLYHIMLYRIHLTWVGLELITLIVIGTDCICSCTSNCHDHDEPSIIRISLTFSKHCIFRNDNKFMQRTTTILFLVRMFFFLKRKCRGQIYIEQSQFIWKILKK